MSMATVWEKILLHLRGYNSYRDQRGVPEQISQAGIAEALGIGVGHVSKVIKRLREDGKDWIDEDFKHVKGSKRKRKVYFLTNEGREKEEEIRDRLKKEDIDLLTKKGSSKIKLSEMEDHLNKRDPISFAVNNLRESNVLDLRDKNRGKDIFVGRREEMSKLKQLLKKVGDGDGRSIFIKGVAGIGKTRLILEFRKHVSDEGFEFLYGNSYSSSSDAYLPVKEAIQRYLKRNKDFDKSLEDIPLFEQYKDIDIDETEIYKAQRQSTFYRTKELLREISFRDPLVIFLDDLQWADKATLDLLYYMLSKLDDGKVLFIGAYRPEDIDTNHPLQEMIRKAIRKDIFEEIELGPIDKPNGRKIIENTIGRDQLPDKFLDSVYEKANGNPLFLQEIAKQAFEKYGDEIHQFEQSYVENMKMPDIIEQLVSRRINKLNEKQRRILQVGTIIGKEVPFDLMNEMLAMDEIELLENVDEIMKANLWHEHPEDDVFHVSNPLILDTIYNDMGELRKKTLHKKLAKTIENLRKDELEEYYSYLANQYLKGGEKEKAFDYYLKSGGYDESVFAHENAVEKYKKALDLAEELDKDRSDILMKMGEANKHMGKFEDSRDNYQEAIVDMKDTEKQQHVYKKIGETYVIQGDYDKALNHIEQGLSLSDKANSARLELLHMKGWTMVKVGRYDDAEDIFNRAQDLAEEFGNEAYIAKIKNDLGAMSVYKGEYSKAIDRLEDAIDIRKRRDEITELGKIYNNLGLVYRKKGQLSRALDYLDQSLEIREERNDRYHMATTLTNMGLVYTNQGKLDQALETHEESLEIWTEIGSTDGRAGAINNIGDV